MSVSSQLRLMVLGGTFAGLVIAQAIPAKPADRAAGKMAVRVIDGDTFDYAGERIRIFDIDAPETHPARCAYEAEVGARATVRLRQLLARPFELQAAERDEDRYGRKLRTVLVGGRSVGDQLIAEGLARRYEGRRRPWCESTSVS